ncbi:MAG: ABC transporter permease [Proteobacteria bacterium]|nr:ABC transporter permease [Pseudomonadota bacterium]
MNAWFSQHVQAFKGALRKLAAQRASSLLNVLVIGIALALPAGGYVILGNLQGIAARFSLEPQLSVFLEPGARPADRDGLEKRLRNDPRMAAVRFVPRDEALAELRKTEGIAEVIAALNQNPLPDAFVIRLKDIPPDQLEALAAELGRLPGVGHVQADSAWARRLSALIGVGRLGIALLAALLAAGLVAVTFNTIRLQVLTQREEIEVARLLGATDGFIRRPFYYLGAIQGLAGGMVGLAVLAGSLALLNQGIRTLAETYGSSFHLTFLAPGDALAVALFASLLGWLGAYLSVSVYLRGMGPR